MDSDKIIIAQSGSFYEQMQNQLESDSRLILSQQKEIHRLTTENLKKSVAYEGALSEARHLRGENSTLRTALYRLQHIAFEYCDMIEVMFGSDENSFTYERLREYLDIAELLQVQYGRNTDFIRRVRERIAKMNY